MRKRLLMTLVEIMIVISIISMIMTVVAYSMKGSLDKGRAFKTKETMRKIYDIIYLQGAMDDVDLDEANLVQTVRMRLRDSDLVRDVDSLLRDGWKSMFTFSISRPSGDLRIYSQRYEQYVNSHKVEDPYPWPVVELEEW